MKIRSFMLFIICLSIVFCASPQKRLQKERAQSPKYQYDVGAMHLNNNDLDEAIKYFRKSIELDPNFFIAYNALGLACFMKGQFKLAEKHFYSCLDKEPSFTEAHNNLGTVYQEMKLYNKAEREYRIAIEDVNYPSRHLAYYNLSKLFYIQNKNQEALEHITFAIKMKPDFAGAYNLEGIIYEKMGKYNEAIYRYETALKFIPNDLSLNFNLAISYFKSNRQKEAKRIFEKIYPSVTDSEMKSKIEQYLKVIK